MASDEVTQTLKELTASMDRINAKLDAILARPIPGHTMEVVDRKLTPQDQAAYQRLLEHWHAAGVIG